MSHARKILKALKATLKYSLATIGCLTLITTIAIAGASFLTSRSYFSKEKSVSGSTITIKPSPKPTSIPQKNTIKSTPLPTNTEAKNTQVQIQPTKNLEAICRAQKEKFIADGELKLENMVDNYVELYAQYPGVTTELLKDYRENIRRKINSYWKASASYLELYCLEHNGSTNGWKTPPFSLSSPTQNLPTYEELPKDSQGTLCSLQNSRCKYECSIPDFYVDYNLNTIKIHTQELEICKAGGGDCSIWENSINTVTNSLYESCSNSPIFNYNP